MNNLLMAGDGHFNISGKAAAVIVGAGCIILAFVHKTGIVSFGKFGLIVLGAGLIYLGAK